ncbi:MAG: hypothetical protein HYS55_05835 [Candidatus Omnitrophica bacterium]|nr:hypothetical protein [Candidatus Omnitrophota bacterium]
MDVVLQDSHILFLGVLILLVSAIVMHYSNRIFNLSFLSIPAVWYFAYTVTIFIPSFFIFYERSGYYRYSFIFALASALVTVPIGILLASVVLKFKAQEIRQYHAMPIQDRPKDFMRIMNYALAFVIGLILFFSWCAEQPGPIPLLYLLNPGEQTLDLTLMRDYSLKLLDSPIRYLYHTTRDFLFPLLMLVAFGNYYYSRSKHSSSRLWFFFLIASSIFGVFFAGANISKSPVFSIVVLMALALFLLKGAKLAWWQILLSLFLSLSFPTVILMSTLGSYSWATFQEAFGKLIARVFISPSFVVYFGFELVPERVAFQGGRFMGSLAPLFGKEPSDLREYAIWYLMGQDHGTGSASGAFVSELFGDFGFPGVILGGILVGIVMQWIQVSILRSPKTVFAIATYTMFIYFFSTLTYLQIAGALILSGAPILWLLYKTKLLG